MHDLEVLSWDLRQHTLDIIMAGGGGHIGGDMSLMNALLVLYENHLNVTPTTVNDPDRDRFVLSKGHSMETYYAILCHRGFLDLSDVTARFSKFGSPYIGHPNNKLPGIEMNSGSLGHGLPVCVGMALAGKRSGKSYRVYTIMGDGELAEGSVWEGAMAAGHYQLDNLCAVVDRNKLQISGTTEEVMSHEPLGERFAAFGWNVIAVNGDSIAELDRAYTQAKEAKGKPTVIISNTTKGYGSPLMENKAGWHHHLPTAEEHEQIRRDFAAGKERAEHE
ncbi:transketolase [Acutalibacter muris]|uniref:Transketolase n=1 Tax=Acutalibacter muris TaxID=1796620 RepID=A0A1Z2XW59_9FIRM|nr:transketolase [Acutalibacter muris]ANU56009.1 transketolase [Hungateiclostridiaceae bacterium KB18]ASB42672.1 transketolase [Acutalibacter muris]QQR32096.1 transketolase [Acutalibacter muris]